MKRWEAETTCPSVKADEIIFFSSIFVSFIEEET